jgi:molybdopterin/thiamine biosynthesis adenylyltransferase
MELTNEHLTRQLDILPIKCLDKRITIIGAGAIGSFTALSLAKMGFEDITVYDFDKIEIENMNCQFYRRSDVGKLKVEALADLVESFTDVRINAVNQLFEGAPLNGIVISAVDSMSARQMIWDGQKMSAGVDMLIDPRMGAETAMLYCMNPHDANDRFSYEKTLYSDNEAVQDRCTAKSTTYTALLLSGLVAKAVKDIVTDSPYPRIVNWSILHNALESHINTPLPLATV